MVRLSELVNQVRRRMSEGQTFAQNPAQIVWQWGRKRLMLVYGKASLGPEQDGQPQDQQSQDKQPQDQQPQDQQPQDQQPLDQGRPPSTAAATATTLSPSNLRSQSPLGAVSLNGHAQQTDALMTAPILQPGERLQGGWWGVYTIKSCVYTQDWIRRYDGLQDNGGEPVWIYEYCLDEDHWSADEIDERKQYFKHLIDLNLRLGEGSDFRIIRPKDVIKPRGNCIYLITRPVPQSLTLDEFLTERAIPWNRVQIERFLTQVLQSLQYLQTYLVNWPGDRWEQALSHGRLTSQCLWIRLPEDGTELNQYPFFIYLGRFPLWEHLFWPQKTPIAAHNREIGSMDEDLAALAHMTFALVRGDQSAADPADLDQWPEDNGIRALYPYVLQLLGDKGRFKSIDSAISVLQALPDTYGQQPTDPAESVVVTEEPIPASPPFLLLWLLLGGGLLLALITWLATSQQSPNYRLACPAPCRLEDVDSAGMESALRYGIEAESSWSKAFFSRLTSPLKDSRRVSQVNITELQRTLEERDSSFSLEKAQNVLIPRNRLLNELRTDQLDAALIQTPLNLSRTELPSDLGKQVVGYDGIAIFVTHSNAQRQDNIPNRLRGRISLQQLRRVLLDPNAPLDGARVQLYWPEDERTVELLKESLFQQNADKMAFERRRREDSTVPRALPPLADQHDEQNDEQNAEFSQTPFIPSNPRRTNNLYERMLSDFETNAQSANDDIIGLGFNRISQVIGQCSVYPLAIVDGGRTHHLLIKATGQPIDETTDLCGDKGTYWVNDRLFQPGAVTYPLAQEMAVVYHLPTQPCDRNIDVCSQGQLLAEKLLTPEGQYLLSEVGLIPRLPIKDIRRMMWGPMAQGGPHAP